jgi:hypothetical protein
MWSCETAYWYFETWNDDGVADRIHDTLPAVEQPHYSRSTRLGSSPNLTPWKC